MRRPLTAGPGVSLRRSAIQAMPGMAAKFRTAAGISGPAVPYRNGK